jgi:hypothetical protein
VKRETFINDTPKSEGFIPIFRASKLIFEDEEIGKRIDDEEKTISHFSPSEIG